MSEYEPIECALHDHIEIACLHRYRLRIRTVDGCIVVGVAMDTETSVEKAEYLLLDVGGARERLRLDRIVTIEPLNPTASFATLRFRD